MRLRGHYSIGREGLQSSGSISYCPPGSICFSLPSVLVPFLSKRESPPITRTTVSKYRCYNSLRKEVLMYSQLVPTVPLASTALLAVTPIIVGQLITSVPDKVEQLKRLLAISLWAGGVSILSVAGWIWFSESMIWAGIALLAFVIQASLFSLATTTFWLSKFRLK